MKQPSIITVTLNPALDHTLSLEEFQPGQLNRVAEARLDPGGKGINVTSVVHALGEPVLAAGFLGQENAEPFLKLFQERAIEHSFIALPGENRTNIKLVEQATQRVSELNCPGISPTQQHLSLLLDRLKELAAPHVWLVLSGSLPASLPSDSYAKLIEALKPSGCRILLDSSGESLKQGLKSAPYAAKPNLPELCQLTGRSAADKHSWLAAIDQLLASGLTLAGLSLGAQGAILATQEEAWFAPALRIPVASTVGAGDAFVAGLTVAQSRGQSLGDSLALATAAAAAAVAMPGTQPGSYQAVQTLLAKIKLEQWR